jgi:hypothetical protein
MLVFRRFKASLLVFLKMDFTPTAGPFHGAYSREFAPRLPSCHLFLPTSGICCRADFLKVVTAKASE